MFAFLILGVVVPLLLGGLWGFGYWVLIFQGSIVALKVAVVVGTALWLLVRILGGLRSKQWPNVRKETEVFLRKEFRYFLMVGFFPFVYTNFVWELAYSGGKHYGP